jgi:hypothetical protein
MGPSKVANAAFNFKPFHGPGMKKAHLAWENRRLKWQNYGK